jgi:pimeloyl-ACP methyl ester carboxylesterase
MLLALLLATALAPDSTATRIVVAPAETLTVATQGSGPPVVLFHGMVGSAWTWRHVVAELNARGHRTIVIEPLGMGLSSRPEKADYSLTAQAGRIAAVMDSLAIGPAIVVTHGLAGSMALRLAVHRADLVSAVVSLEGGPAERAATKGFRKAMRYVPWVKFFGGVRRVRGQMAKSMRKSSGDPSWITEEVIAQYTAGAAADLDATLKAFLRIADAKEPERLGPRLVEIQCPVVLLQGLAEHDGSVGQAELDLLADSVKRFTMVPVPGAGHYLQEEQPGAVVRAILALAEEVVVMRE